MGIAITTGLGTQEQVVNFEVRIKLLNPDDALRPGMSCNADIQTETVLGVLSVPIQSVTARSSDFNMEPKKEEDNAAVTTTNKKKVEKKIQEIVFVVKNGKAKTVNVETGISNDNYIQIKSGLSDNEEVVSGSYRAISRELHDGVNVRVEKQRKNGPGNTANN